VQQFAEIGSADWPGENIVDILTTRAAGLFIWADTVVRFLEQGVSDKRLDRVLDG